MTTGPRYWWIATRYSCCIVDRGERTSKVNLLLSQYLSREIIIGNSTRRVIHIILGFYRLWSPEGC